VSHFPKLPEETLEFAIDHRHVQQFIKAVSRESEILHDAQPSFSEANIAVPITYLQCRLNSLPMNMVTHPQFPIDIIGSVHESSKIVSYRPLFVSIKDNAQTNKPLYHASCRLEPKIRRSDKNDLLVTVVTSIYRPLYDGNDTPDESIPEDTIMDITNEYRVLNPNRHKVNVDRSSSGDPTPIDYFDENLWEALATWDFPVDTGRKYAALNGDINPIHMFPITAKIFGYKSCIAHGMYNVCKLANESRIVNARSGVGTITARFTRPTLLPNDNVMAFLNKHTDDYVIGVQNNDGEFKETVVGTIRFDG